MMIREGELLHTVHIARANYAMACAAFCEAERVYDEATNAEASAVMALVAYYKEVD